MEHHEEILKEIKILYVEDDCATAEELGQFLKRRAGRVYIANDGEEGLDLFEKHTPDIIIADLFLPKLGGIEMVERIRKMGHETPVIITSAISDSNVILSAVDAGIVKYLLKPIRTTELLNELVGAAEKLMQTTPHAVESLFPNKKELEGKIKKEVSAILKTYTGKGPRDVNVFISSGTVEIYCCQVLTVYEKTLLENYQNIAIIEQNRRLFYQVMDSRLVKVIQQVLGRDVHMTELEINIKQDYNRLIFQMHI
ncbi:MAG: Na-translocating system protein MpsC family protein [Anaerovoracaceae bacterium]|jgi:CheY-like chemotaxis protein